MMTKLLQTLVVLVSILVLCTGTAKKSEKLKATDFQKRNPLTILKGLAKNRCAANYTTEELKTTSKCETDEDCEKNDKCCVASKITQMNSCVQTEAECKQKCDKMQANPHFIRGNCGLCARDGQKKHCCRCKPIKVCGEIQENSTAKPNRRNNTKSTTTPPSTTTDSLMTDQMETPEKASVDNLQQNNQNNLLNKTDNPIINLFQGYENIIPEPEPATDGSVENQILPVEERVRRQSGNQTKIKSKTNQRKATKKVMVCQEDPQQNSEANPTYIVVINASDGTQNLSSIYNVTCDKTAPRPVNIENTFTTRKIYDFNNDSFLSAITSDWDMIAQNARKGVAPQLGDYIESLQKYNFIFTNNRTADLMQTLITRAKESGVLEALLKTLLQKENEHAISKYIFNNYLSTNTDYFFIFQIFELDSIIREFKFNETNVMSIFFTEYTNLFTELLSEQDFHQVHTIDDFVKVLKISFGDLATDLTEIKDLFMALFGGAIFNSQAPNDNFADLTGSLMTQLIFQSMMPEYSYHYQGKRDAQTPISSDSTYKVLVCIDSNTNNKQKKIKTRSSDEAAIPPYHVLILEQNNSTLSGAYLIDNDKSIPKTFTTVLSTNNTEFDISIVSESLKHDLQANSDILKKRPISKMLFTTDKYLDKILLDKRIRLWIRTIDDNGLAKALITILFDQSESDNINHYLYRIYKNARNREGVKNVLNNLNLTKKLDSLNLTEDQFLSQISKQLAQLIENVLPDQDPNNNNNSYYFGPKMYQLTKKLIKDAMRNNPALARYRLDNPFDLIKAVVSLADPPITSTKKGQAKSQLIASNSRGNQKMFFGQGSKPANNKPINRGDDLAMIDPFESYDDYGFTYVQKMLAEYP